MTSFIFNLQYLKTVHIITKHIDYNKKPITILYRPYYGNGFTCLPKTNINYSRLLSTSKGKGGPY